MNRDYEDLLDKRAETLATIRDLITHIRFLIKSIEALATPLHG